MSIIALRLPLYGLRSRFLHYMQTRTAPLYAHLTRRHRTRWQVDRTELLRYPPGSLGQRLGHFLTSHDLRLIPGFENHDVFHVLLDYGLTARAEIELQWCLLGNGKRSVYAFAAALAGAACFPENWGPFREAYRRGRKMRTFHHWYFEYLLQEDLSEMRRFLTGESPLEGGRNF